MKKYIANIEHSGPVTDFTLCVGNECEQPDHGTEFYLATEVEDMTDRLLADKNARIAELEKLLRECINDSGAEQFLGTDLLERINSSLMGRSSND